MVVYSDWRGRFDRDGNPTFSYVNKSALYIGEFDSSGSFIGNGDVWEMSAVGETAYLPSGG